MNHFLTFDGKSTDDFGVYLIGNAVYNAPGREYEKVSVPGRNGDLLIDNGRYSNLEIAYDFIVYENFEYNISALRNFLASKIGYFRLEDTYNPYEYRLAKYSNGLELEAVSPGDIGTGQIYFDCKPQRYLKSGEKVQTFTANGTIKNPTLMVAKPLIRVTGTGALSIGSQTITITSADGYTDIDCDLQDAFKGAVNCNQNIQLTSGNFFTLEPGNNSIVLGSGITKVEITPRWWLI